MSSVARLRCLMPRLTCVAFEHIAEYRARRFQGLYGPLLHLLSRRVDEVWADCERRSRRRAAISFRATAHAT